MTSRTAASAGAGRRAFSLIEVLMAIMILGIGVISVAALLPAGIAQQQRSGDDVMGPIVANSAVALIRTKLRLDDFGTFEEFSPTPSTIVRSPRVTVWGDWSWLRPGVMFDDDAATPEDDTGAYDVFSYRSNIATEFPSGYGASTPRLYGIPWNRQAGTAPPLVRIQQSERYYPIGAARPQYVWDCAFRRFGGRIYVAVFVYRVISPGGEPQPYTVADSGNGYPPLPVWIDLRDDSLGNEAWRGRPWPNQPIPRVDGTKGLDYDPLRADHAWMLPSQWLLDQNNMVHRVAVGRRSVDEVWDVELSSPVPAVPRLPVYHLDFVTLGGGLVGVVTDIWYIPRLDPEGTQLEPVYVSVQAL